ncbi:unnamed protein product [Rotaria sp. Silwood2]|nr:unnamed protein product [Rotaria sp. Silwood2]
MSISTTHKNNRTKYTDDDDSDYYSQTNGYSMSNKVKYLTPRKYHLQQHTQGSPGFSRTSTDDEVQSDKKIEHTLTPSKYRLRQFYSSSSNHNNKAHNRQYQQVSFEDIDQDRTEISYEKYPIIMGDFILTKKPIENHNVYNYQPKHRPASYIYKGTLNSSEIQERASNRMKQFIQQRNRTLSSNSIQNEKYNSNISSIYNNIDDQYQSSIPDNEFSSTMMPSSNIVRSATNDNLHDVVFECFRQQNDSLSKFYRSPLSTSENFDEKIPSNSYTYFSTEPESIYYFGQGSEYYPTDDEEDSSNEDSICISFGRGVEPNPVSNSPLIEQPALRVEQPIPIIQQPTTVLKSSTFTTHVNYNNNNLADVILQEVIEVGTSTSSLERAQKLLNTLRNNRSSSFQRIYLNNRESILTNQSFRSKTEIYGVNKEATNYENDYENDMDHYLTNQNSTRAAKSTSSAIHSYMNVKKSTNYPMDTINNNQSSKQSLQTSYNKAQSHRSTPESSLERQTLHETNSLTHIQPIEYENVINNNEYESSLSKKSKKSHRSHRSAKPPTKPTETGDGSHIIDTNLIPRRPSSTPPTDLDDEIRKDRERHNRRPPYPNTPRPHRGNRPDDKYDSDTMSDNIDRIPKPTVDPKKSKLIDGSTQSEEKPTRNIGTMHDPIETRNFGNEVQPQTSSTQTSFPIHKKPPKPTYTFIERPEPPEPIYDESYPDSRICDRPQHIPRDVYYDLYDTRPHEPNERRSPSPSPSPPPPPRQKVDYIYDGHYRPYHHTPYKEPSHYHQISSEDYRRCQERHTHSPPPPPPSIIRHTTPLPTHDHILIPTHRSRISLSPHHRSRKTSPQHRSHTPTPSHRVRYVSPSHRPRSATPRHRPQMHSQETDTSLDAMRKQHHTGVQYEPRSTQEKGTTPSLRTRKPITNQRLTTFDSSIYRQQKYPTPYSTLTKDYDRPRKTHCMPPTIYDDYVEDYDRYEYEEEEEEDDETPSMHDQSTMAELIVYLDHYTQCESQPFMADRYIQTTPTVDDNEQRSIPDYTDESFIRQLPRSGSISIQQPIIIQPDSLPRRRQPKSSPTRPKRDGLDYTGNNLEVSLHHGLQRVSSIRDSPLLNIGTENVLNQSTAHEYVTPFETRFIYESDSSSTLRSRSNGSVIVPVLNSARTHIFTRSPARQSRSNGNFYLSTAPPPRSTNSSLRINITDKS